MAAGAVAVLVVVVGAFFIGRSGGDDPSSSEVSTSGDDADSSADDSTQGAGGGGFPGANGTITEIDGTSLVVATDEETDAGTEVTVETTDDTVLTETVAGSQSDLALGDNVTVMGEASDSGSIAASTITDSGELEGGFGGGPGGGGPGGGTPPSDGELPEDFEPPEGFEPPADGELPEDFEPPTDGQAPPGGGPGDAGGGGFVAGEITGIDGEAMTVETADGETVAVSISSDTEVSVTRSISVDDLVVGDTVRVVGETEDSTITASSIQRGELSFPGGSGGRPDDGSGTDDSTAGTN